jgi:hypothetical protein
MPAEVRQPGEHRGDKEVVDRFGHLLVVAADGCTECTRAVLVELGGDLLGPVALAVAKQHQPAVARAHDAPMVPITRGFPRSISRSKAR